MPLRTRWAGSIRLASSPREALDPASRLYVASLEAASGRVYAAWAVRQDGRWAVVLEPAAVVELR